MKACFITYDGLSDQLGTSQILPYVEGLAAAGHQMWLVSFEKPERYAQNAESLHGQCARVGITWLPQVYHKRPPVLSTLIDLAVMRRVVTRLHAAERLELLHCRSYLPMLVALPLQRRAGLRVLFDLRGFWADERVEGGLWPQGSPLYRGIYQFFKRQEARWVSAADAVVSLTHAGARIIRSWQNAQAQARPLAVIPCSADFDHFALVNEAQRRAAREALGLPATGLVIGYLGALGTWYRLPEMLRFYALAREAHPEARLLVLTAEPRALVDAEAARQGLDPSTIIVRFAPRAEVPRFMAAADVGLNFIQASFSKQASSPTKLGELLAMGIPVLANAGVGDVAQILTDTGGGLVLPDLSDAALRQAVADLPALLQRDRAAIRQAALRIYDLAQARASYVELYRQLSTPG